MRVRPFFGHASGGGGITLGSGSPVKVAYASGVTSQAITINVSTGGTILICANTQGVVVSSIAASGWTFSRIINGTVAGSNTNDLWIGIDGTGGAVTCTVNYATSTTAALIGFGCNASTTPGVQGTSSSPVGNSPSFVDSFTSATLTPATPNCAIFIFQGSSNTITSGPGSPWTTDDSLVYFGAAYYLTPSSGDGYSAAWTSTGTSPNASVVLTA